MSKSCRHSRGERGYRPTAEQIHQYSRRDFLKLSSLAAAGAFGYLSLPGLGTVPSAWGAPAPEKVVRVHCGYMQDWNFSSDEFWEHVKMPVMNDMFARGLCELTGRENIIHAWENLLVGYQPGHKIAIKLNLNSYDENANQTVEMAYAVIESLKQFGVDADDMKVFDVVRVFPDYWRERWDSDVEYVNQNNVEWDGNATVYFPAISTTHRFPKVLSQADHLINVCLQKGHKSYVTGSLKNHFGSQEDPSDLHIERFTNIAQLASSGHILGKTRLIVTEAAYMTWHYEGRTFSETHATDLFPTGPSGHSSPNYMMFGTNMVAMDCVLADIQNHERAARNQPTWPNDFLDEAAGAPYYLGPREVGSIINTPGSWSDVDLSYDTLDYSSFHLPQADRSQIDAMNLKLKEGLIHSSQLQHLIERYNDRL
ncbi:MAG: DUF362 domain-containing protein [bacterium]|nr:DUF362 domain-containing protein [bacterium]